jgi:hypothetical protein
MLRPIEARDIGLEWERVRAGLVEVKKMTTDDWLPEDVYMALKQGGATLYVGEDDAGDYLGFVVMRLLPTFHSSKVEIWCAHSSTKRPLMRRFWPQIQEIAAKTGATKIAFMSARAEWAVAAKRLGFAPKQVSYEFTL